MKNKNFKKILILLSIFTVSVTNLIFTNLFNLNLPTMAVEDEVELLSFVRESMHDIIKRIKNEKIDIDSQLEKIIKEKVIDVFSFAVYKMPSDLKSLVENCCCHFSSTLIEEINGNGNEIKRYEKLFIVGIINLVKEILPTFITSFKEKFYKKIYNISSTSQVEEICSDINISELRKYKEKIENLKKEIGSSNFEESESPNFRIIMCANNIKKYVKDNQEYKEKIENPNSKELKGPKYKELENANSKELKSPKSKELENANSKELENTNFKELENANSKELKVPNFKELENANSKELKVPNFKELENANSKELENAKSKELKGPKYKELENAKSKELKVPNFKELENTNFKELENANSKELENAKSKELKVPNFKELENANSKELKVPNFKELENANSKELKVPNFKELENTNSKELENANSKELENANSKELENANSKELKGPNFKELENTNSKELENANSKELENTNFKELENTNSKELENFYFKESENPNSSDMESPNIIKDPKSYIIELASNLEYFVTACSSDSVDDILSSLNSLCENLKSKNDFITELYETFKGKEYKRNDEVNFEFFKIAFCRFKKFYDLIKKYKFNKCKLKEYMNKQTEIVKKIISKNKNSEIFKNLETKTIDEMIGLAEIEIKNFKEELKEENIYNIDGTYHVLGLIFKKTISEFLNYLTKNEFNEFKDKFSKIITNIKTNLIKEFHDSHVKNGEDEFGKYKDTFNKKIVKLYLDNKDLLTNISKEIEELKKILK